MISLQALLSSDKGIPFGFTNGYRQQQSLHSTTHCPRAGFLPTGGFLRSMVLSMRLRSHHWYARTLNIWEGGNGFFWT